MSYQPSFKKELNRLYCIRWVAQHKYDQEHISWKSKLEIREMIEHLPINFPKIYQRAKTLDELTEPKLDRWVLKPDKGAANRGVYPITKKNGRLFNQFTQKKTTWKKIIKEAKESEGFKPPFYIEEYIGDKLPYNWELYCFDGEVGLIRQRQNVDRVEKHYKFWSTDFKDLGLIEEAKKDILRPKLPPPLNPKELIRTAKIVSKNIPFTFCRIDLFDTPKGVYFGELTHHPGIGNNFNKDIDKQLGRLWLQAEARKC